MFPLEPPELETDGGLARADAELVACPGSFNTLTGGDANSAYLAENTALTWPDAEHACELLGPGIHLAAIDSRLELNALQTLVTMKLQGVAWVGVARDKTTANAKASFLNVTFSSPPDLWAPNEPNNGAGDELTAHIGGVGQDLIDESFISPHGFLCECDHRETRTFVLE